MRRLLIGLVVALVLCAIGASAQMKNPGTLTYLWINDIKTLDPAYASSTPESYPIYNIYDRLLNYYEGEISTFIPGIASVVPSVDNGLIVQGADGKVYYTFPIQRGVRCHQVGVQQGDGTIAWVYYDDLTDQQTRDIVPGYGELTAEDVKYSWMRAMMLGISWMSDAILSMVTGGEYANVEELAVALAGVDSFDQVDEAGLIATYEELSRHLVAKPGTLELILDRPFPAALGITALPYGASIIDKEWAIAQGAWPGTAETWIDYHKPQLESDPLFEVENGSGPFVMESWDRAEKKWVLKRFENYFRGPAQLERVIVRCVPEWSTRRLQFEAGDADLVVTPTEFLDEMATRKGVTVVRDLPCVWTADTFFVWPVRADSAYIGSGKLDGQGIPTDFFSDLDVRKGFCYAMDYEAMLEQVLLGYTVQARGPTVRGIMGYREDSPIYSYDPVKAEEHFRAAWGGAVWENGFKVTAMCIAGTLDWEASLGILQQRLAAINPRFKLEILNLQWASFADLLWGESNESVPLVICNWGPDYTDPGGPLGAATYFLSSTGLVSGYGGAGYRQLMADNFDPLLKEAWNELDPSVREPIYARLQEMSHEYATSLFLFEGSDSAVYHDYLKGYTYNPITYGALDYYAMYKEE